MTETLFDERLDELAAHRARHEAARVILAVKARYLVDQDRTGHIPDEALRKAVAEQFKWIVRELDRAAEFARSGRDPGDAGGFGGDAE